MLEYFWVIEMEIEKNDGSLSVFYAGLKDGWIKWDKDFKKAKRFYTKEDADAFVGRAAFARDSSIRASRIECFLNRGPYLNESIKEKIYFNKNTRFELMEIE